MTTLKSYSPPIQTLTPTPPSPPSHLTGYRVFQAISQLISLAQIIIIISSCHLWERTKPTYATIYFFAFVCEWLRSILNGKSMLALRQVNHTSRGIMMAVLAVLFVGDVYRLGIGWRRDGPTAAGMWNAFWTSLQSSYGSSSQAKELRLAGKLAGETEDASDPTQPLYWFTSFVICLLQFIAVVTVGRGVYDDYIVLNDGYSAAAPWEGLYAKDLKQHPTLAIMSVAVMGMMQNANQKSEEWIMKWVGLAHVVVYVWVVLGGIFGPKGM